MANPQPDQFTRISNELFEAFLSIRLSEYERVIWLAILRKTYGFQKTTDKIAYSQIEEITKIRKAHISRAIKQLLEKRLIVTSTGNRLGVNKDYDTWLQKLPLQVTNKKKSIPASIVTSTGNKKLPLQELQKKERNNIYIGKASPENLKNLLSYKINRKRGGKPTRIGEVLQNRGTPNVEAQQKCFYLSERLGIDFNSMAPDLKARWMRFFKDAFYNGQRTELDKVYSYWYDSSKFRQVPTQDKIKLFMWKFYNPYQEDYEQDQSTN